MQRVQAITHKSTTVTAMDLAYTFDVQKGLLLSREQKHFNTQEAFTFDSQDRLIKEQITRITSSTTPLPEGADATKNYTYDNRGRMTYNSLMGVYDYTPKADEHYKLSGITYNTTGLAAVNQRGNDYQLKFNSFKAPKEIFLAGKDRLTFEYSLLKERSQMVYNTISGTKTTKYYTTDKAYEWAVTSPSSGGGGTTTITAYIDGDPYSASYIQHSTFTGTTKTTEYNRYLHRDYQGTILAITGSDGKLKEQRRFDAWGQIQEVRHYTYGSTGSPTITTDKTLTTLDRGYTGHEHLQSIGLINMNGRLYDPLMRRFLSPDNFIQDPYNTQNYNRYGYVYNNPLRYVDINGEEPITTAIVIAAIIKFAAIGAAIGATMQIINNAMQGNPLWWGLGKATAMGAVNGAISFGIGSIATNTFSTFAQQALFEAVAHGVKSGIMSSIEGGDFMTGFASGAASSLVSSGMKASVGRGGMVKTPNDGYQFASVTNFGQSEMFKAVMIASGGLSGGISSTIAGGNFWKGVSQGLITAGLNAAAHWVGGSKDNYEQNQEQESTFPPGDKSNLKAKIETKNNQTAQAEALLELTKKGMIIGRNGIPTKYKIGNYKSFASSYKFVKSLGNGLNYFSNITTGALFVLDTNEYANSAMSGEVYAYRVLKTTATGIAGYFTTPLGAFSVDFLFQQAEDFSNFMGLYISRFNNSNLYWLYSR